MANYKFKSVVEAYQSNEDTFEQVYNWVSTSGNATDKTPSSYKIVQADEIISVSKNKVLWVMKCSDGKWLAASDLRFQQLFEAV
jgi:hypothetical protein